MQSPKIYRNSISEISYMLGLSPNDLKEGMILFCHCQFPNNNKKYIAIPMEDKNGKYYDLYQYEKQLDYENIPLPNSSIIGPALIHNVEYIIKDANGFKNLSQKSLNIAEGKKKNTPE